MVQDTKIKCSVIIPTCNRCQSLDRMLQSVVQQNMLQELYEVIVIDNASTDSTRQVCDKYANIFPNFVYIYDERPGLHTGRNVGYLKAKSDILVYADDDIIAFPTWLSSICKGFECEEVVLIGGNVIPKFEGGGQPEWLDDLWIRNNGIELLPQFSCIMMGDDIKPISPYFVFGCNFAVKKEIIHATRGFHPDGMPDKFLRYRGDGESYVAEYVERNDLKTMFLPEASVYHVMPKSRMTPESLYKISIRIGVSMEYTELRSSTFSCVFKSWLIRVMKFYWRYIKMQRRNCTVKERANGYVNIGRAYLLLQYVFRVKVRKWIQRENYLNEEGVK